MTLPTARPVAVTSRPYGSCPRLLSLHTHFLEAVELGALVLEAHDTMGWTHPDHAQVCTLTTDTCVRNMAEWFANDHRAGCVPISFHGVVGQTNDGAVLWAYRAGPFALDTPAVKVVSALVTAAEEEPENRAASGVGWQERLVRDVERRLRSHDAALAQANAALMEGMSYLLSAMMSDCDHCLPLPGSIVQRPDGRLAVLPSAVTEVHR